MDKMLSISMYCSFFVVLLFSVFGATIDTYDPTAEKWVSYIERSTSGDTLNLASLDTLVSTGRYTSTTTLSNIAPNHSIICDVSGAAFTLNLPTPAERLKGYSVRIVQLGASGIVALTVDSSSGSSGDFQAGNSSSNSYTYTAGVFQVHQFTCMDVGSSTLRWVLVY